jgi:cyclopropane-fatty-acyl-phospholipid synthase
MSLIRNAIHKFAETPVPDPVSRAGIGFLVATARRKLADPPAGIENAFAREMSGRPIAEHTKAANDQHYEVPSAFFQACLGPRLKYSSCLYRTGKETLGEAEVIALDETCRHAQLADGQAILELGCGWGSLSLWMAQAYRNAKITSVSNSSSQKAFIDRRANALGLNNLTVITADMNDFSIGQRFDRIVSVEMFEHMANWRALLTRARGWLKPDGRMFIHVFTHRTTPYRFEVEDEADWIGQHFFTGGVMPSHDLIAQFPDLFEVEADWRWSGDHYRRTAEDWLANYDRNARELGVVLREVYGDQAVLWKRRWRLFFLATAGLFGHRGGGEWGVSHYRLKPVAR